MKTVLTRMGWVVCLCAAWCAARGEDVGMSMTNGVFLVSPLAGWNRNETSVPGRPGSTMTLKDTAAEYMEEINSKNTSLLLGPVLVF